MALAMSNVSLLLIPKSRKMGEEGVVEGWWRPRSRGFRVSSGSSVAGSLFCVRAVDNNSNSSKKGGHAAGSNNYVVPLQDKSSSSSSCITRPLAEILRDLNKRVPDNIVKPASNSISWYHANRMLSFYAPGWCGEIRDVIFSDNGNVTVVYRVKIRGSDGEAHRDSTGTVSVDEHNEDPVAAAEEIAFCRACARFGLGLYLYHEEGAL
ncbi:hypothetical protein Scep_020818 [Stephania cephalantha]|uniref:Cobalt ion binding protein n=1 Tax=Stephania cephalantha TaxID=152367 RepID=A0AAP0FBD6_9MAGN